MADLIPIFGILLVMIPVLGLTTIVTLRWGLMPFMERLAQELKGTGFVAPEALERQVEELSRELDQVTAEVGRLREGHDFHGRLLESRGEGRSGSPGEDGGAMDRPVGGR